MDTKVIAILINGSTRAQALEPLKDRAVLFSSYTQGETALETLGKAVVLQPGNLASLAEQMELYPVIIKTDEASLAAVVEAVAAAKNRHTLIVVAANDGVLFSGAGVTRDRSQSDRPARAADILPTVCYMAGLPLPGDNTGALLYQAMKDPNAPFSKIASLQESVAALEYTIERSKRQAWDKHDCA